MNKDFLYLSLQTSPIIKHLTPGFGGGCSEAPDIVAKPLPLPSPFLIIMLPRGLCTQRSTNKNVDYTVDHVPRENSQILPDKCY